MDMKSSVQCFFGYYACLYVDDDAEDDDDEGNGDDEFGEEKFGFSFELFKTDLILDFISCNATVFCIYLFYFCYKYLNYNKF